MIQPSVPQQIPAQSIYGNRYNYPGMHTYDTAALEGYWMLSSPSDSTEDKPSCLLNETIEIDCSTAHTIKEKAVLQPNTVSVFLRTQRKIKKLKSNRYESFCWNKIVSCIRSV